jgi:hypothetical protein
MQRELSQHPYAAAPCPAHALTQQQRGWGQLQAYQVAALLLLALLLHSRAFLQADPVLQPQAAVLMLLQPALLLLGCRQALLLQSWLAAAGSMGQQQQAQASIGC